MVLLYGVPNDGPFELIADALEEASIPFVILNQRRFNDVDFGLHYKNGRLQGELTINSESYDLNRFTGIYNRAIEFAALPEAHALKSNAEELKRANAGFTLLNDWLEVCDKRVVNKTSAMSSNSSKPYQLSLIQPFFRVPDTLITNSVDVVNNFLEQHTCIIYKSASSVRSIVKTIEPNDIPCT